MDVVSLWWLTLAAAGVVILVVAALLVGIVVAANRIDRHAADIWMAGKDIATNTIQIWQIEKTNDTAARILEVAQAIATGAGSIDGRLARLGETLAVGRTDGSPGR